MKSKKSFTSDTKHLDQKDKNFGRYDGDTHCLGVSSWSQSASPWSFWERLNKTTSQGGSLHYQCELHPAVSGSSHKNTSPSGLRAAPSRRTCQVCLSARSVPSLVSVSGFHLKTQREAETLFPLKLHLFLISILNQWKLYLLPIFYCYFIKYFF